MGGGPSALKQKPFLSAEARKNLGLIAMYNADASLAEYQALHLAMAGLDWQVVGMAPDGEPLEDESPEGTAYVSGLNRRVYQAYGGGGLKALAASTFSAFYQQGGVGIELDVADDLRDVVDIDLVSPAFVGFKKVQDPQNENREWVLPTYIPSGGAGFGGQRGEDLFFNPFQFRYVGFMPLLGDPYGRPVILPTLDTAWPQQALRDTLERLLRSHAFAKPEIIVKEGVILAGLPTGATPEMKRQAIEDELSAQAKAVELAEADDWYVHTDVAETDVASAQHGTMSVQPDEMIRWTDQDQIVALKTLPSIMGRAWGNALSSTGAQEWVIYARGIESVRMTSLDQVAWAVNQALRIAGIRAVFRWLPGVIRSEDRLAEAQAEEIEVRTTIALLDKQLIGREEAAMRTVGHPPPEEVEAPEPAAPAPAEEPPAAEQETLSWDVIRYADNYLEGGHSAICGCGCVAGEGGLFVVRDPFIPDADVPFLSPAQIMALYEDPDEDDAEAAIREDYRWMRQNDLGAFVGIFDAVPTNGDGEALPSTRDRLAVRDRNRAAGWTFDVERQRYRYPPTEGRRLGRLVDESTVARLHERLMDRSRAESGKLASKLAAGKITGEEFARGMAGLSKTAHVRAQMLAVGGKERMTSQTYGRAGGLQSRDLQYLGRFSESIRSGQLSAAEIANRASMYFEANVRRGYEATREDQHQAAGYRLERRVTRSANPCRTCQNEASMGWVEIGTLRQIGVGTECGPADKCEIQFRFSEERALPRSLPIEDVFDGIPFTRVGLPVQFTTELQ